MKRRDVISNALGYGAALLAAPRLCVGARANDTLLPAQPRTGSARDGLLAEIAKRELARHSDIFWHHDVVGIADFGLRSSSERMHLVDLERGVVDSYLVTHGDGSDPAHDGWLDRFSNVAGSHCTSQGLYMTYGWYSGRYGTSMRLEGLDPTNSNALDRAIVMHRARYAERAFLEKWGRLGRSNGCFAMGNDDFNIALLRLGGGRALFSDSLGLLEDGSIVQRPSEDEMRIEAAREDAAAMASESKTAEDYEQSDLSPSSVQGSSGSAPFNSPSAAD